MRAAAQDLARTVRRSVHQLQGRNASVLRAAYTPRRWPKNVVKVFESLTPLAVRLSFADDPWPERSSRAGLEEAVATRLSAALVFKSSVPIARMRAQAQKLLGRAVLAYAKARSLEAPSLGLR